MNGFEARQGTVFLDIKKDNECFATFIKPKTGEYKVVAYNAAGQAASSGYVTVEGKYCICKLKKLAKMCNYSIHLSIDGILAYHIRNFCNLELW